MILNSTRPDCNQLCVAFSHIFLFSVFTYLNNYTYCILFALIQTTYRQSISPYMYFHINNIYDRGAIVNTNIFN